jgi:predicted dehydrogenase
MTGITMLGTGLIGGFYTQALQRRGREQVLAVYSRTLQRARDFARRWDIPRWTADLEEAVGDSQTQVVVVGLPNDLHRKAVELAARAGKAVLCTKPLARTGAESRRMLETVEQAGVFAGYLEDLVYTPKTLKALETVRSGALGRILWVRSREAHSGPHSAWFWDRTQAGGGAIVDLGCHCIEIIRSFVGKEVYPREVLCWADTLAHPVESEDNSVTLIRFDGGALGQFEVSWTFRGGMDLRDEVSGTEGTIWLNHFLRTGFEVYSSKGGSGYVAEKAEAEAGWTFPVGDEVEELGFGRMFDDMFRSLEAGKSPRETFYDGYVVNAVIDACYRSAESKRWEPVDPDPWRGSLEAPSAGAAAERFGGSLVVKRERMPDGRLKLILKDPESGRFSETFEDG